MKEKSHQLGLIFIGRATVFVVAFLILTAQTSAITVQLQVAAGENHTVGLKSDGTVVTFGSNGNGQLNVSTWTDVVQLAAGYYHTVGLKSDGTVLSR